VPAHHYGWLFGLNVLMLLLMTWINGRLVKRACLLRMLRLGLMLATVAALFMVSNA
jgi:DHA1 family bicyclomycin/chloramphenicol resistance-like MFS transporter